MSKFFLGMIPLTLTRVNRLFRHSKVSTKITMISRQADEPPVDFLLLRDELASQAPEVDVVFLTRKLSGNGLRKYLYPLHMLRQMQHIATSRIVLLDGYCIVASICSHKKETRVIQIWHATGALKKFGWQTVGKPSGSSQELAQTLRMHRNYDIVLAPSPRTAEIYGEAFRTAPDQIQLYALPRIDLLDAPDARELEKFKQTHNLDPDKKTILYIPTFREGRATAYSSLVDQIDFSRYDFAARLHPLERSSLNDNRIVHANDETAETWLRFSDIVITDYSSLAIEASLAGKPLYFYVYDLEAYLADPGLNIFFEDEPINRYVHTHAETLAKSLEEPYDYSALGVFKDRYIADGMSPATPRLVNYLLGELYGGTEG